MAMTLVRKRLYFGMDPLRLRDAANRVLTRVPEDVTAPAIVGFDALAEDFLLTASAGRAAVNLQIPMCSDSMLSPLAPVKESRTKSRIAVNIAEI